MITAKMETITPEIAKKYLEKNTRNYRSLSKNTVDTYAEDMKIGKWEENGECIAFYENGDLFDGQHRLHAIVKSGVTLRMMVERGIPNSTTITDWGSARTINQWGRANGLVVSSTVQGMARAMVAGFGRNGCSKGKTSQYIEENYTDLREAEKLATVGRRHALGQRAPIAMVAFVARKLNLVNESIIKQFFSVFNTGSVSENEKRDPSAPLIASRTIITRYRSGSGGAMSAGQFSIVFQALMDYKKNTYRKKEYKEKDETIEWLRQARMMDGTL